MYPVGDSGYLKFLNHSLPFEATQHLIYLSVSIDSGSTITLDATTDIVLDADGGDIFFKDAGTTFGSATNTSGNLIIKDELGMLYIM